MIVKILSNAHSRRVFYRENGEVKCRTFAPSATDEEISEAFKPAPQAHTSDQSDTTERPVAPVSAPKPPPVQPDKAVAKSASKNKAKKRRK